MKGKGTGRGMEGKGKGRGGEGRGVLDLPLKYMVTLAMPHVYPQNCPFPFDDLHPRLIHPSLDLLHSPPQTASRSNQPFYHNSLAGQTDRPTDGLGDKPVPTPAHALLY